MSAATVYYDRNAARRKRTMNRNAARVRKARYGIGE